MLGRFAVIAVAYLLCVETWNSARAEEKPEFLVIQNNGDKAVSVYLRAAALDVGNKKIPNTNKIWNKPISVAAGMPSSIDLRTQGYEPFDITIRQDDGIDTVFDGVKLCSIMKECMRTGQTKWPLTLRYWRWETDADGKKTYRRSEQTKTLTATADEDEVLIPFTPIGLDNPTPWPRRPDPKK